MSRTKQQILEALEAAATAFREAIYGKDVRQALVDVDEAVYEAVDQWGVLIDDTLTQSGEAADAQATGDMFARTILSQTAQLNTDCNSVDFNSLYFVSQKNDGTFTAANWPLTTAGYLITFTTLGFRFQMAFSVKNSVNPQFRTYRFSDWDDWRDNIGDTVNTVALYNSYDVAASTFARRTATSGDITYTWNGNACTVGAGTATSASANVLAPQKPSDVRAPLPSEIKPEHIAAVKYHTTDPTVYLRIIFYDSENNRLDVQKFVDNRYVLVPATAAKWNVALCVDSGTVLSSNVTVSDLAVLSAPTNTDLADMMQDETNNRHNIKMLVFGNSFSYSTLGYLPIILQEIAPEVNLTLGILYRSGGTVAQHIDYFENDTPYDGNINAWYSEYTSSNGAWINVTGLTSKNVLKRHKWDYITFQEACRTKTPENVYGSISNIEALADDIEGYEEIDYPVEFLANIQQAAHANYGSFAEYYISHYSTGEERSNANFYVETDFYKALLESSVISDVLPGGTAIQNARQLDVFKAIGTTGEEYLVYDDVGHLINGIAPMISAYAVAYKLLSLIGLPRRIFAAYDSDLDPTDTLLTEYNYVVGPPGPSSTWATHGACVGVDEANKLLASKCALMAVKEPFKIYDISQTPCEIIPVPTPSGG